MAGSERSHRLERGTFAPALAALALLLSGSCGRSDEALQPVARLVRHLEGATRSGSPRCEVGSESRPALGCPLRRTVLSTTVAFPKSGTLSLRARLPAALAEGRVVLETSLLADEVEGWKDVGPVVLEGTHPGIDLSVPVPEGIRPAKRLRVQIVGVAVPERPPVFRTEPLAIGPRSTLRVGLAIDPVATTVGAAPVRFRIDARGDFGTRAILREVVDPAKVRSRWLDRRVDLAPLGGQTVSFELRAEVVSPRGSQETAWSLPIWGNPLILERRPRRGQRNVILVSLDTLRADFVGGAYQGRRLTPALDERAREGAVLREVLAPYPSTSASHMSLFTSTYPAEHKVLHAKHHLSPERPTLAEILAAHSFVTAAFTEDGMLAAAAGFDRGFDEYDENRGLSMWDARGDIERTLARGLRWLGDHRGEKFFLFLHTYQVHWPYQPPAEHDVFDRRPAPGEKLRVARMRNRYAGEVAYTDQVLRRLFATVRRLGLERETIVVVTADHGDEFGEHGGTGHSKTVYEEVLRVPLIFWAPGLIPPVEIEGLVSLIDVAPTLLDLLHLPPAPGLRGTSFAPALLCGTPIETSGRFAEGPSLRHPEGRLFAARTAGHKWIGRERAQDPVEIYDLRADPAERENLAGDPALRAEGRRLLRIYRALDRGGGSSTAREVDPRTQEKLRALGYVDPGGAETK